mgnify:CR=1 FL=1
MYLEKYEQYLGTGERNAAGLDLKTFLEEYNPKLYDTPANTVDNLIFTYVEENGKKRIGKILLIKRGNHPSIGWCRFGGCSTSASGPIANRSCKPINAAWHEAASPRRRSIMRDSHPSERR